MNKIIFSLPLIPALFALSGCEGISGHAGLYESSPGNWKPRPGLEWSNPNDPNDNSVRPAAGYKWSNPNVKGDFSVVSTDSYSAAETPTYTLPLTSPSYSSGTTNAAVANAVQQTRETQEALFSSAPAINWITANPSFISVGGRNKIQIEINIVGSPARVGRISILQKDGFDIGTLFTGSPITFSANENMAYGDISVVAHKRGSITIEASIANPDGTYTRESTTLHVR